MKTNIKLSPLLACLLIVGCHEKEEFRISAPDKIEAGKTASVALSGTFDSGTKILWTTTSGHIVGPNDALTATLAAPNSGTVTLVCTITRPGQKTVALDKQIEVMAAGGAEVGAAPPIPVAGNPVQPARASAPMKIEDQGFIPSGFMGDDAALTVDPKSMDHPHTPPHCQKWTYLPKGNKAPTWAAVAWQYPENNWGDRPGKNLNGSGYRQVSVWARGVRDSAGVLPKVQFKAGGATAPGKPFQASFEVQGDFVQLTEEWKQYTLDVSGKNLSQVVVAFILVIRAQDVGPRGVTFYLDDIEYQ
jgi:hypothetical protein